MESTVKLSTFATPIAVLLGGIIIAGAVYFSNTNSAQKTANQPSRPATAAVAADASKVKIAGEPVLGNVNAPITIAYWYDYQCPFCKKNEQEAMPQIIKEYVDTGKAKIVFKDFQFLGADSQTLGQYSRAVWEAAPNSFYDWHKAVYENSGTENTGWATQEKIMSITTQALGKSTAAKVAELVTTKGVEYQKLMDADKAEGTSFGINGTPGFIIGKQLVSGAQPYAQLKAAIDAAK
jgi:protein-disulfide isomerase